MSRVDELIEAIVHEQTAIITRVNSGYVDGIHEDIMERHRKCHHYRAELESLVGREETITTWDIIIKTIYHVHTPTEREVFQRWLDRRNAMYLGMLMAYATVPDR